MPSSSDDFQLLLRKSPGKGPFRESQALGFQADDMLVQEQAG